MTSTTAFAYITRLPEVNTNRIAQMKLAIDYWANQYGEAKVKTKLAWNMYADIVDDPGTTYAERDEFFKMATTIDTYEKHAWQEWQTAKQNYLATLN
jgi:hypothetical protein